MVLALGALLDLETPAHNPEAIHYYQLARAALALKSVLDDQTIPAIQALVSSIGEPRNANCIDLSASHVPFYVFV